MIYYYTGTGNSRYVAERISAAIQDDCENLFERLCANDCRGIRSERPLVFVSPTYAWQLPHIVRDWIANVDFQGNSAAYFILTGKNGWCGRPAQKLCRQCCFLSDVRSREKILR